VSFFEMSQPLATGNPEDFSLADYALMQVR